MSVAPTPFDDSTPQGGLRPIIRYKPGAPGKQQMINGHWGSNPRFADGVEFRFIRSEGKTFPDHRCLMPASEFHMQVGKDRHRVRLVDGNFFYLACLWEPQMADWPLSFRIITVAANLEVSRFQDRHGAIILRRHAMEWLDGTVPEADFLVTPQAGIFVIEEIGTEPVPPQAGVAH